jgi:hypothetical protein
VDGAGKALLQPGSARLSIAAAACSTAAEKGFSGKKLRKGPGLQLCCFT